jgi:hypothetical protein
MEGAITHLSLVCRYPDVNAIAFAEPPDAV